MSTSKWKNQFAQKQENMISGGLDNLFNLSPQLPSFFASKTWKQTPPPEPVFVAPSPLPTPFPLPNHHVHAPSTTQYVVSDVDSSSDDDCDSSSDDDDDDDGFIGSQEPFVEGARGSSKKPKSGKKSASDGSAKKPKSGSGGKKKSSSRKPKSKKGKSRKRKPKTPPAPPKAVAKIMKVMEDEIPKNAQQVTIETVFDTPPPPPTIKKTQVDLAIDAIKNYVFSMETTGKSIGKSKKFNIKSLYEVLAKAAMFLPSMFDLILNLLSAWYLERIHHMNKRELGDENGKLYKEYLERVKTQVKNVFYLLISLYMVLNWWYGFNYFNRFISTSHMVEVRSIPPLKIVLESNIAFTNIVNYLLFGLKFDEARVPFSADVCALLWKYRPLVFIGFLAIFQSVYVTHKAKIEKVFYDAITGKKNGISGINIFATFMSWIRLDLMWSDRMIARMKIFKNFFIAFFVTLLKLVFILAFLPLGVLFLYLFLFFWSFFPILAFNGTSAITMIKVMLIDLTNTVDEPSSENPMHKIYRMFANHLVPITIFIMFFSIFAANMKAVTGLTTTKTAKMLFGMSFIVFLIFLCAVAKYGYDMFREVVPATPSPVTPPASA
jgi:hypothetical protein